MLYIYKVAEGNNVIEAPPGEWSTHYWPWRICWASSWLGGSLFWKPTTFPPVTFHNINVFPPTCYRVELQQYGGRCNIAFIRRYRYCLFPTMNDVYIANNNTYVGRQKTNEALCPGRNKDLHNSMRFLYIDKIFIYWSDIYWKSIHITVIHLCIWNTAALLY